MDKKIVTAAVLTSAAAALLIGVIGKKRNCEKSAEAPHGQRFSDIRERVSAFWNEARWGICQTTSWTKTENENQNAKTDTECRYNGVGNFHGTVSFLIEESDTEPEAEILLNGVPAEPADPLPGYTFTTAVMTLKDGDVFSFRFHPKTDEGAAPHGKVARIKMKNRFNSMEFIFG